jgi:hypothetical protein
MTARALHCVPFHPPPCPLLPGPSPQVSLWDTHTGSCAQRISVYGGGWPLHAIGWCPVGAPAAGGAGTGLLAATGGERSVVMLEPRK